MRVNRENILGLNLDEILEVPDQDFFFDSISPLAKASENCLSYVNSEKYMEAAKASKAKVLIVPEKLKRFLQGSKQLIISDVPEHTMAIIASSFFEFNPWEYMMEKISSTAKINSALPDSVFVGDFSLIGKNVTVGENVKIGSHVIIEDNVSIGDDTIIFSNVVITSNCKVGKNCRIQSQSVIGSSGFVIDEQGQECRIPDKYAILEDNVDIGSNCTIDRGLDAITTIKQGAKLDNKIQVSADAIVGANSLITADNTIQSKAQLGQFNISGGCNIFTQGISTADKCTFGAVSKIDRNINEPGAYGGVPLQPMREYFKTLMSVANLGKLRKEIQHLKQKLK